MKLTPKIRDLLIEELSKVLEHPGKPGYKRKDISERIKQLKDEKL